MGSSRGRGRGVAAGEGVALSLHATYQIAHRAGGVGHHLVDQEIEREGWLLMVEPDDTGSAHRPGIGIIEPGRDAQQGGLAGAVLTDEAGDLAGGDVQVTSVSTRRSEKDRDTPSTRRWSAVEAPEDGKNEGMGLLQRAAGRIRRWGGRVRRSTWASS